ncbi:DUF1624 domain-containing protein [Sinorhizobium sp. BG8]|uniref:heparan-alpha-glucosaminide N-acetyltransferase n=1 Tax=Sinorhizobium sp. BG8 TaxID=2613773 RepID=UPI00248678F9|nr:DUF1624 domain-containing protein [Sinorhizobium sp. BG8]
MTSSAVSETPDSNTGASTLRGRRIPVIDQMRGVALIAMAIYHFTWDLGFFGYVDPATPATGGWKLFARLIAGSFLFLSGCSLVLGHGNGIRWHSFAKRFARIVAAAAIITVGTWFAFPQTFIFFGILHAMAAASLIGLAFLRVPAPLTILVAAAAFAAPWYLRSPFFDPPWLWWVGLSASVPRSNDYVPVLPWIAPFLLGMAAFRIAVARGWTERFASIGTGSAKWKTGLAAAGRHSLAIYLIHQPVIIALVYAFSLVAPAAKPDPVEAYRMNCTAACTAQRDKTFCTAFCDCTLNRLLEQDLFNALNAGAINVASDGRIAAISEQCTADSQSGLDLKE